jgi:uncharacterized protein YggU (UPF0235/DUF167 family)
MSRFGLFEAEGETSFDLRVQPGAPRTRLDWSESVGLRLRVAAPPVDGAANEAVVRYLAREVFHVPQAAVRLVRGERSRNKRVAVRATAAEIEAALTRALE